MQKYGIDEQEAYKRIRTRSMDLRISMKEVAESIIDIEDMKRR
jgi:AmiR/NasT family two-component response regulator